MSNRHHTLTRFGLNVRRRREAAGLSQEALAEKADLDRTYISGIERGTRNPTILRELCVELRFLENCREVLR